MNVARTAVTHIIVEAHVHPAVKHNVFASDGDQNTAAADILTSPCQTFRRTWFKITLLYILLFTFYNTLHYIIYKSKFMITNILLENLNDMYKKS